MKMMTIGLALALAVAAHAQQEQAQQILKQTGVTGGLVVHVGCGDGKLTAALRAGDSFLAQGLDRNPENIKAARDYALSRNLLGPVSFKQWTGSRLPYVDNLVNLLVVSDEKEVSREEILRTLTPGGVALVNKTTLRKPWPSDMDSWGHILYDATGNPVSKDTRLGPPAYAPWMIGPRWARHHDASSAGDSMMVSANGRLFSIRDEAPAFHSAVPQQVVLQAQDAFNGVILWKRPLENWRVWQNRGQPAVVTRRIVAMEDRLYVTLGYDAPVSVLDAVTGKELLTLPESDHAGEIIVSGDTIFITAALSQEGAYEKSLPNMWEPRERWVKAYRRQDGKLLWQQKTGVFPLTLAADNSGLYFHNTDRVVCLDPATGKQKWAAPELPFKKFEMRGKKLNTRPGSFGPTLLVQDGVVLYTMTTELTHPEGDMGHGQIHAFDAADGHKLWEAEYPPFGEMCPKDIYVIGGVAYILTREEKIVTGFDLRTGKKAVEFHPQIQPSYFHPRCHRYKATCNYLIPSNQGFELVDLKKQVWQPFFWVRGSCSFGYLPSYGMLYLPPGPCACFADTMLPGTYALAPRAAWLDELNQVNDASRLEKGAAYGAVAATAHFSDDWPTYRADAVRRGYVPTPVPGKLAAAWTAKLGGKLTAPTVAAGKVFVAQVDQHTLHALDAATGQPLWSYTTGGRIDSPPTIVDGALCIFGSHDGYVYCLRAADGALVWRFRAAPLDLQMNAEGQLESLWPASGSVLLQEGKIWCVAGRSIYLAGGMRLLQLDPISGKKVGETILDEKDPQTGEPVHYDTRENPGMPVALPDILSSDGKTIYMRSQEFDLNGQRRFFRNRVRNNDWRINKGLLLELMKQPERHLFSAAGFLDDSWFHRIYWAYANVQTYASGQFYLTRQFYPSGQIMVLDDQHAFTYARHPDMRMWLPRTVTECFLMRTALKPALQPVNKSGVTTTRQPSQWNERQTFVSDWSQELPIYPRALAKAADRLFVAGPPDPKTRDAETLRASWAGNKGGSLLVIAPDTGATQQELRLESPPVWDGMAVARSKVFICLMNGEVACFKGEQK